MRKFWQKIIGLFKKKVVIKIEELSGQEVEKHYIASGKEFGDAVSYIILGQCEGFEDMLNEWAKWEKEYACRGYRTLPIDDFIEFGNWSIPLEGISTKRDKNESTILYAGLYRAFFLNKIPPAINIHELANPSNDDEHSAPKIQMGIYYVPSMRKSE